MATNPPPPGGPRRVDPTVWKSSAGTSVHIPSVDSAVYYFPQGHAEQSSHSSFLSPLVTSRPMIFCRVTSVALLAHPDTDEVFARIRLVPARDAHANRRNPHGAEEDDAVVSFAKVLTPSDANNGGGFSVPRFCADSIFPPLNFNADPPVQNISITDVHGVVWEFRHIYRGTPRRHLLTTGWSKFVNSKKLVAGDSVVFMRNRRSGELFVGVRRAVRSSAGAGGRWNYPVGSVKVEGGWERSGGGRVSPEEVAEAAELAVQGREFEVVCYPRAGWADFVVGAEAVEESLSVVWSGGMRVKMAVETEDSSRVSWVQGTVSLAVVPDTNCLWQSSPWRMLQVTWDEPEALQNIKRVSPWQVKFVAPTPPLHSTFPPSKKFRISQNPELPTEGDRDLFFPMNVFSNSLTGNLNPSLMNYDSFPAGMQGARQDTYYVSTLSNFICENSHNIFSDEFFGKNALEVETVSTELNIGSSHCDNLSPDSQSSVHFLDNELTGKQGCSPSTKVSLGSFQLFGQIIHAPVESGYDGVGCAEGNECKMSKKTECGNNSLDLSLTSPCTKLRDGLDVHCQRASAVEACSL
ncbi:hypothetical protein RHGRI_031597 [Rhododendron griersonianum]|uniref:Auxin response factor n=1 Tax=Rhododendron griersonianum TaxID=479676 RepID=A0AAV6IAZ8_9ERIC|nr:hypothetical protein RHGRI_031597 [Rhododendron griersonianum]KAG5524961.1 hypothetical protein RHGRI_031597 [Rhododendron griersonianum]